MADKKLNAFFCCPLGDRHSKTRERSDWVKDELLVPALGEMFDILHADNINGCDIIHENIVEHLKSDDLVIVDLTDSNPNVFYELGVRHLTGKPTLLIKKENVENLPFDLESMNIICYPESGNIALLKECRDRIKDATAMMMNQYKVFGFCRNIAFNQNDVMFRVLGKRTDENVRKVIREAYGKANEIDIFAMTGETSAENLGIFKSKLLEKATSKIRILSLSPESKLVEARFAHIRNGDTSDFFVKSNATTDSYKKIFDEIKANHNCKIIGEMESSLELKHFDEIPYFSYVRCDNTIFLAVYTAAEITRQSFVFLFKKESFPEFVVQLEHQFDVIWGSSKTKRVLIIDSTSIR